MKAKQLAQLLLPLLVGLLVVFWAIVIMHEPPPPTGQYVTKMYTYNGTLIHTSKTKFLDETWDAPSGDACSRFIQLRRADRLAKMTSICRADTSVVRTERWFNWSESGNKIQEFRVIVVHDKPGRNPMQGIFYLQHTKREKK